MSEFSTVENVASNGNITETLEFFNKILSQKNKRLYVFTDTSIIIDIQPLEEVVEIFNQYPEVYCVYTDHILSDRVKYNIYFPSFHQGVCNNTIINTPLICRGDIGIQFDTTLKYLYYHDFLKRVSQTKICWHVPKLLFSIVSSKEVPTAQKELQRYTSGTSG